MRIDLINMPFSTLVLPSLALTQLESRLNDRFGGEVSTRVLYLNHDFGSFLGMPLYQDISLGEKNFRNGLGEWFFRHSAFPDVPDNSEEYFNRYYERSNARHEDLRQAILEKRTCLDAFLNHLIDKYKIDQADIVGFSSMFAQNLGSIAMARQLKARNPQPTTVMGGANCESPMGEELARHAGVIDYVFSGPALVSFPAFVEYTLHGRTDERGEIPGVIAKCPRSQQSALPLLTQNSNRTLGEDLDIDVPIPLDYDPFLDNFEQHFGDKGLKPMLLFETSRGCWWGERAHCMFCGLNGLSMKYRAMNPDSALTYIRSLLRYTPRTQKFLCVDNIMPKSFIQNVWPRLENDEGARFFYEVKADMNSDELAVLSKAGVKKIQPGIEALVTSTLKLMKKGTSGCTNVRFLMNCLINDVSPVWNILVGFPGETANVFEKYVQDIPKLVHIPPPVGVFPVRFDRYSPYFNQAKEYGLQLRPFEFYDLIYPLEPNAVKNLAYYFSDESVSDYKQAMLGCFDELREKVIAWRKKWLDTSREAPQLYALHEDGNMIVVDTRFAEHSRTAVSPEVAWLLTYLQRPHRVDEAVHTLCDSWGTGAEQALDVLRERQWVFEDGDRILGIVLEHKPLPLTDWIS